MITRQHIILAILCLWRSGAAFAQSASAPSVAAPALTSPSPPLAENTLAPQLSEAGAGPASVEAARKLSDLQFGFGYAVVPFRSAPFNSNLSALRMTLIWSPDTRVGLEANILFGFGDSTLNKADSKLFLYTAGPSFTWRTGSWRPWVHGLGGWIHMYPQTAYGLNAVAFQVGGGVDRRISSSFSVRFESQYLHTRLFSSSQNTLTLGAGVVIHFKQRGRG